MTSSLTHQTQLSFNPRFLPIDLSQPIYGGLYPIASTNHGNPSFTQFVNSTFLCKELQDVYAASTAAAALEMKTDHHLTDKTLTEKLIKVDSDSDSCSNTSSFGFQHARSSSPSNKCFSKSEKKKKQLVRDDAYFERRRKNNDAAKRSRDSRRKKEDEVAMRAALLEQENLRLRFEVERLRTEIDRHRIVAINSKLVADVVNSSAQPMQFSAAVLARSST